MRFVDNWRRVLKRAWSMRLIALAFVFQGAEAALPLLDGLLPIPRGLFAALSFVATGGAAVTRLIAQPEIHVSDEKQEPLGI